MQSESKLSSWLMFGFGILIGLLIVFLILWSSYNSEFMYFIAANIITLIILAFTWNINKKSNNDITDRLIKIEGRIDKLSDKNNNTPTSIEVKDDPFWQKQYELLIQQLMDENNRFWTRFNVSLAVNAGILVAFIAILTNLDKIQSSGFEKPALFGIIILGILSGSVWFSIISAGNGARKKLLEIGKDLEKDRKLPVNFFGNKYDEFLKGSITERSKWYPIIYIGFWVGLTIVLYKMNLF